MAAEETRDCPYCLEPIRGAARRCKFCGSRVVPTTGPWSRSDEARHYMITPLTDAEVAALEVKALPENTITLIARDGCGPCKSEGGWDDVGRSDFGTQTCTRTYCISTFAGTFCFKTLTEEPCVMHMGGILPYFD